MNDTHKKAVTGVKWTLIQSVIVGLLGPLVLIIQVRYLTPREMGYVAIIMIVIALLQVIENMGMSQAIIQNDQFNNRVFTSLFVLNIILSLVIGLALYLSAPLIQSLYKLDGLSQYLRLIVIVIIVQSPSLILKAVLQKELLMRPLSIIEIFKKIIQALALITMFILGFGVLSVVYAAILETVIGTIALVGYFLNRQIVKFDRFESIEEIMPYLKFGALISIKQIFTNVVLKVDEILIGLVLSPEVLGLYHFAKNMLERVRLVLTSTFSRVLFPYFSKLQHNLTELNFVYNKITEILALLAFPIFTGIALTAQYFIPVIFGENWIGSLNIFRIISLGLIPMLLTFSVATSLLYAVNKPGIVLKVDIVTNLIYLVVLTFVAQFGVIVVATTYVLFILAKSIYLQMYVTKALKTTTGDYLKTLKYPFIHTVLMSAVVIALSLIMPQLNNILMLLIIVLIGVIVYVGLTWLFNKTLFNQIVEQIKLNLYKRKKTLRNEG